MYPQNTNFYGFLIFSGIIGLLIPNYIELGIFSLVVIILSIFLLLFGSIKWGSLTNVEEKLKKMELERKEATLDFDITDITAIKDIDYIPADFDLSGEPQGFDVEYICKYIVNMNIFNNSPIKNTMRKIELKLIKNTKEKPITINIKTEHTKINIEPRAPIGYKLNATLNNHSGMNGDVILVTLTTMDMKEIKKKFKVKNYTISADLADSMGLS